MHWRTRILELGLLAFFAVFLLYPLLYVIPGAASDDEYAVRLDSLGNTSEDKLKAAVVLAGLNGEGAAPVQSIPLPHEVRTYPTRIGAEALVRKLMDAGASAEVVRRRRWTTF